MSEGDRYWPNLQEQTVDIGRGGQDGEVQKILRKWYFGESVISHRLLVGTGQS